MIELGKKQILTVKRIKTFGVYLGCDGEDQAVLLPAKYVPEGSGIGDEIEVFVYRDSQDRLVATTLEPKLRLGETAVLEGRYRQLLRACAGGDGQKQALWH